MAPNARVIAVTGSSGLIGSALVVERAALGDRIVRLVRQEPRPGADEVLWDPATGRFDAAALEGIDAVVHLAGAGIASRRWTASYRRKLVESRVAATELLTTGLARLADPPKVLLSGSAVGYYGNPGDAVVTEDFPAGSGFIPDLVEGWERATRPAEDAGIRTVHLRTSTVMAPNGGALAKLVPLFRLGLGGRLGAGTQWMSWLTLDDHVAAMGHLLDADISGPVNLATPNPVTNAEFARTLGRVLRRPAVLPVPAFGPRLLLGREMADLLLFDSIRLSADKLISSDFRFEHPLLEDGLRAVLGRPREDASS